MGRTSWLLLLLSLAFVSARNITTMSQAMTFLERYNYMGKDHPDSGMRDLTKQTVIDTALMDYQANMGLNQTGVLDDATKDMMSKPRCGNRDKESRRDITKRRKRFSLQGFRWNVFTITYRFNSYSQDLSRANVERIIAQAFRLWSDTTNLEFVKVEPNQDAIIEIEFVAGDHGDDNPFDGPGGTLAHAFFPNFGGDAHFDEDERFTDGVNSGINLLFTAVHEIGHSLGLEHSDIQAAIMFPTYLGFRANLQLHSDDIAGIRALYGSPTTTTTTTTTSTTAKAPSSSTTSAAMSSFCRAGTVNGVAVLGGATYVFQGSKYVRLDSILGIAAGYPRDIQDDWSGLTGGVDAVLESQLGDHVFIFKGSRVWRFTLSQSGRFALTTGYPRNIKDTFQDLPNDVDLAFVWSGNGRSYIFKGNRYYRLDVGRTRVLRTYPRDVDIWRLPPQTNGYSAAFQASNGRTFFFTEDKFYRYNDFGMRVDNDYPQPTRNSWLRCSGNNIVMEMDKKPEQYPTVGGESSVSSAVCILSSFTISASSTVLKYVLFASQN